MWEYWKEWLVEALPLNHIIPLILILGGAYALGGYLHSWWLDSKAAEVVTEVANETSSLINEVSWTDVQDKPMKVSEVVHMVGQETSRVQRI